MNEIITYEEYTKKSFIVNCDRDKFKNIIIKELKGKFQPNMKKGPAFIVPITSREKLQNLVEYVNKYHSIPKEISVENKQVVNVEKNNIEIKKTNYLKFQHIYKEIFETKLSLYT